MIIVSDRSLYMVYGWIKVRVLGLIPDNGIRGQAGGDCGFGWSCLKDC